MHIIVLIFVGKKTSFLESPKTTTNTTFPDNLEKKEIKNHQ